MKPVRKFCTLTEIRSGYYRCTSEEFVYSFDHVASQISLQRRSVIENGDSYLLFLQKTEFFSQAPTRPLRYSHTKNCAHRLEIITHPRPSACILHRLIREISDTTQHAKTTPINSYFISISHSSVTPEIRNWNSLIQCVELIK